MLSEAEVAERVRAAFAQARFERSYADVTARARRRRAGGPVAAGLAVAATAVALVLVVSVLWRPDPGQPGAAWGRTFKTECANLWSTMTRADDRLPADVRTAEPPSAILGHQDGDVGLRVYLVGSVLFACLRDESGRVTGRIEPSFLALPDADVTTRAVLDPSGGPEYLVGRLSVSADRVVAVRSDGGTLDGQIQGGLFLIWAPAGGLSGAEVEAYMGGRRTARDLPRYLDGPYDADAFAQICDAKVRADRLIPRPGLSYEDRDPQPPLRSTVVVGGNWLRFYGMARYMAACTRMAPDGYIGLQVFTTPKDTWDPLQYMSVLGELGYVFGAAPTGAESVEVYLDDGRTFPAEVGGGYFFAGLPAATRVRIVKIVAYTRDTVYETGEGGVVHTRPR
jgi:hypothetical protein